LFINGQLANQTAVSAQALDAFRSGGALIGLAADAEAVFEEFVNWPVRVPIPKALTDRLAFVPLRADGEVLVADDFSGAAGSLAGRKPTTGSGVWTVVSGDWYTASGVARVRSSDGGTTLKEPAEVLIDCGATDVEVTASFSFPKDAKDAWLPGFTIRA